MIPFSPFSLTLLHGAPAEIVYGDTVFVGAGTIVGTGDGNIPWPAGHAAGDLGILAIETINEAVSTPSGWTPVGSIATTTGATKTKLSVFSKTAASAAESDILSSLFSGRNHYVACIVAYRDVAAIEADIATYETLDSLAVVPLPAITTTAPKARIVYLVATNKDLADTTVFSAWTNANLTDLTERADRAISYGEGGGLGIADGILAAAGDTGAGSVTQDVANRCAAMTLGLMPAEL